MRRPAWIIGDVAELSLSQLDPLGFGHGTAKARILGMFGRQVVYLLSGPSLPLLSKRSKSQFTSLIFGREIKSSVEMREKKKLRQENE